MKPVTRNLNPFLNVQETTEEVESDEGAGLMVLDEPPVVPLVTNSVMETNPFRRRSGDSDATSRVGDGERSLI